MIIRSVNPPRCAKEHLSSISHVPKGKNPQIQLRVGVSATSELKATGNHILNLTSVEEAVQGTATESGAV